MQSIRVWRIRRPDGSMSDMANLTWLAAAHLLRPEVPQRWDRFKIAGSGRTDVEFADPMDRSVIGTAALFCGGRRWLGLKERLFVRRCGANRPQIR
jgi:hypothetical protein